ncbi:hypothetical protein ATER59S_00956 [Aquamicrobium terrae]
MRQNRRGSHQTVEVTLKVRIRIDDTHPASSHVEDILITSRLFSTGEVSLVAADFDTLPIGARSCG